VKVTIEEFARFYELQRREGLARMHPGLDLDSPLYRVSVKPGRVYTKVDFGDSGALMIEKATGAIFGIKGYGQVHKGHRYGTLDDVSGWNFQGYHPVRPAPSGAGIQATLTAQVEEPAGQQAPAQGLAPVISLAAVRRQKGIR
jgi:hypothetical protein